MNEQLEAAFRIITKPKTTLANLPDYRLYLLGLFAPLYFGYLRIIRKNVVENYLGETTVDKYMLAYLSIFIIVSLVIFMWAVIVKGIISFFKKKLTVFKILNLYGYSMVPRLIISIPGNICLLFLSAENKGMLVSENFMPLWVIVSVVGIALMIYSLFLFVYGIIVSKSIETKSC